MKNGFTLIELMITVAVIAIISAIAIPSYQNHILKSRRSEAITQLLQAQLKQEKQWLTSSPHKYSNNINELGISNSSYYTFSTEAQDNGYQLKATAKGSQLKDSACLSLTINQHSDKTPSNCWE